MGREEETLRKACEALAREEAEQMETSLTPEEIRQAEKTYRHHKRQALGLIRRKTAARPALSRALLPVAAALLLLAAGVWMALNKPSKDPVPLHQAPTASVIPYYSPVPTPSPTLVPPTSTPSPTIAPTFTPKPTATSSPAPTKMPNSTQTPTPAPTEAPISAVPPDWTGSWFPMGLPGLETVSVAREENRQSAVFTLQGETWTFSEYDGTDLVPVPEDAAVSYIQWEDGAALRMEDDTGVTLAWTRDGRSFSLRGPKGNETAVAKSVKKIEEE